jgi:hypothetical protein
VFECATNANLKPSTFTLSRLDVNVPSNMSLMGRDSPKRCDTVLTGQSIKRCGTVSLSEARWSVRHINMT